MGRKYRRIPWGEAERDRDFAEGFVWTKSLPSMRCHDCGVEWNQLHLFGDIAHCDMEECPICHDQLIGCPHSMYPVGGDKQFLLGV